MVGIVQFYIPSPKLVNPNSGYYPKVINRVATLFQFIDDCDIMCRVGVELYAKRGAEMKTMLHKLPGMTDAEFRWPASDV